MDGSHAIWSELQTEEDQEPIGIEITFLKIKLHMLKTKKTLSIRLEDEHMTLWPITVCLNLSVTNDRIKPR